MRPVWQHLMCAVLVAAPAAARAQGTRTFYLIAAGDTVSAERVRRTSGRLDDELLVRPLGQRIRLAASLSEAELVTRLEGAYRQAGDSARAAGAPPRTAAAAAGAREGGGGGAAAGRPLPRGGVSGGGSATLGRGPGI